MRIDPEDVVTDMRVEALREGVMRHAQEFVEEWMQIPECDVLGHPVASVGRELFTGAVASLIYEVLAEGVLKECRELDADD